MKKRNLLILTCGALLASSILTACASNQSAVENGQSKTIGFMQLANEDKQRIWFRVRDTNDDGEISKDDRIQSIYVIKNSKANIYDIYDLNLAYIKDKKESEIIKLAREYDEKYFDEQKKEIIDSANNSIEYSKREIANYKTYNVETDQQKYEVEKNIQFEEDNIQKQNQLLQAVKEVTYEDALKLYSSFPLEAEVETDSSGNNIASEKLTLLSYNLREEDNGSRYTIVSNVINSNLESPIIGEIYDRTYKGFRYYNDEFLITSSLDKSVNLGFDKLNTKNVTEE
ncbi:hypothetical protein STPL106120_01200 [Streptococcus pluranimalium]|uniref:hypothetical protein n=1 Tax=Streptococcus pluranimalium TaxID=82348 RepID=UPI0039ED861A